MNIKKFINRLVVLVWLLNNPRHHVFSVLSEDDLLYRIKGFCLDDLIQKIAKDPGMSYFDLLCSSNECHHSPWEDNEDECEHPNQYHRAWRMSIIQSKGFVRD